MRKHVSHVLILATAALIAMPMSAQRDGVYQLPKRSEIEKVKTQQGVKVAEFYRDYKRTRTVAGENILSTASVEKRVAKHTPAGAAAANIPAVRGNEIWSMDWVKQNEYGNWYVDYQYGIYDVPTTSGTPTPFYLNSSMAGVEGAVMGNGQYRTVYSSGSGWSQKWNILVWDVVDGEFTLSSEDYSWYPDASATTMVYDPTTDKIYGSFFNSAGDALNFASLSTIDQKAADVIAPIETGWSAIAVDSKGQLWVIDQNGLLLSLDKTTGETAVVGKTGLVPDYMTSGLIDPATDVFYYWLNNDAESSLFTIDLKTAKATCIATYEDYCQIVGAYFPVPLADDKAPAAATALELNFEKGALSGELRFNAPTTYFDGTAAPGGMLNYEVTVNDEAGNTVLVSTGEASYGSTLVTVNMTLPSAGLYTFIVTTSNAKGTSPKASITMWIGDDVAPVVDEVTLVYEKGAFIVTWPAITEGEHADEDGYFVPADVRYRVTRCSDGTSEVVASNLKFTKITDAVEAPASGTQNYYYTVEVLYNGEVGTPVQSNPWVLGSMNPPYNYAFDNYSALNNVFTWTVEGNPWKIDYGYTPTWDMEYFATVQCNNLEGLGINSWITTPGIEMKKGMYYEFSALMANYEANFLGTQYGGPIPADFYVATSPTLEAMQAATQLGDTEVLSGGNKRNVSRGYIAPADGIYYFGIHIECDYIYSGYVKLYSWNVSAAIPTTAPGVVDNLVAYPDENGDASAFLEFNCPTKDIDGNPLESLSAVNIYRDGIQIANLTSGVAPGGYVKFIDNNPTLNAVNSYRVAAVDGNGVEGVGISTDIWVGLAVAAAPENVQMIEEGNTASVNISWNPVLLDDEGYPIALHTVKYNIEDSDEVRLADQVSGCEYTYDFGADFRGFQYVWVGSSVENTCYNWGRSNIAYLGKPFEMPYLETFPNGRWASGQWFALRNTNYVLPVAFNEPGVDGEDGAFGVVALTTDGYFNLYCEGYELMMDGVKIAVPADAVNPYISFYYYAEYSDDMDTITPCITTDGFANVTKLEPVRIGAAQYAGWNRALYSLEDYKGQEIQVRLDFLFNNIPWMMVDRFSVSNIYNDDLAFVNVAAPDYVDVNTDFTVTAYVMNDGLDNVEGKDYSVVLYRDNEAVATAEGIDLASGQGGSVAFTERLDAAVGGSVEYFAVVDYSNDEDLSNNGTVAPQYTTVYLSQNEYPSTHLTGSLNADGMAALTWEPAEYTAAGTADYSDDFENYEPWAGIDGPLGDWTLTDADHNMIANIPDHAWPTKYATGSFFLVDVNEGNLANDAQGQAHSGDKFIASMYDLAEENGTSDWIISPELQPGCYVLSFWAKSYDPENLESFRVCVSSTDQDVSSFTNTDNYGKTLLTVVNTPAEWTQYSVLLPAGTKYYAIQCVSTVKRMFMLDDISLTGLDLTLEGYNVYRDGILINEEPIADATTFVDETATQGIHSYCVTVVWDKGESSPSNTIELVVTSTSVEGINGESASIAVERRNIVVSNAAGLDVSIVAADGKTIYRGIGEARVEVAPGVYAVKVGDKRAKLMVR